MVKDNNIYVKYLGKILYNYGSTLLPDSCFLTLIYVCVMVLYSGGCLLGTGGAPYRKIVPNSVVINFHMIVLGKCSNIDKH